MENGAIRMSNVRRLILCLAMAAACASFIGCNDHKRERRRGARSKSAEVNNEASRESGRENARPGASSADNARRTAARPAAEPSLEVLPPRPPPTSSEPVGKVTAARMPQPALAKPAAAKVVTAAVPVVADKPEKARPSPCRGGGFGDRFAVHDVDPSDTLNIRAQPDAKAEIVGTLPPDATGLLGHGNPRTIARSTWREIECGTLRGWVNDRFLLRTHKDK